MDPQPKLVQLRTAPTRATTDERGREQAPTSTEAATSTEAGKPPPPSTAHMLRRNLRRLRRLLDVELTLARHPQADYCVENTTRAGQARMQALEQLAARLPSAPGFRLLELAPRQGGTLRYSTPADGELLLSLDRPQTKRCYTKTSFFAVSYRRAGPGGADTLAPETAAFLDRLIEALRAAEQELRETPRFPELLWESRGTEISYYPGDRNIDLRPTLACNHHCGFCNSVDHSSTDSVFRGLTELLETLPDWAHLPVQHVTLTGGEPTLLRGLPQAISSLSDLGYLVELQTNGMALAEREFAERLQQAGLWKLLISLHSADPAVSDAAITHFEGGWDKTVRGIDNALSLGLRVDISHVIHRTNYARFGEFVEFVGARWGRAVHLRLAFVAPTGAAGRAVETFIAPLPEVVPALVAGLGRAAALDLSVTIPNYCGVPPCLLVPHEAVSESVLRDHVTFDDSHVQLEACRSCAYRRSCPGPWASYLEVYGDPGLRPIPEDARVDPSVRQRAGEWLRSERARAKWRWLGKP